MAQFTLGNKAVSYVSATPLTATLTGVYADDQAALHTAVQTALTSLTPIKGITGEVTIDMTTDTSTLVTRETAQLGFKSNILGLSDGTTKFSLVFNPGDASYGIFKDAFFKKAELFFADLALPKDATVANRAGDDPDPNCAAFQAVANTPYANGEYHGLPPYNPPSLTDSNIWDLWINVGFPEKNEVLKVSSYWDDDNNQKLPDQLGEYYFQYYYWPLYGSAKDQINFWLGRKPGYLPEFTITYNGHTGTQGGPDDPWPCAQFGPQDGRPFKGWTSKARKGFLIDGNGQKFYGVDWGSRNVEAYMEEKTSLLRGSTGPSPIPASASFYAKGCKYYTQAFGQTDYDQSTMASDGSVNRTIDTFAAFDSGLAKDAWTSIGTGSFDSDGFAYSPRVGNMTMPADSWPPFQDPGQPPNGGDNIYNETRSFTVSDEICIAEWQFKYRDGTW